MRLIDKSTKEEVEVGDKFEDKDGDVFKVEYFRKPHKSSSAGKVTVSDVWGDTHEYYVGIIGLEWIEREDRPWDENDYWDAFGEAGWHIKKLEGQMDHMAKRLLGLELENARLRSLVNE